jgi:hypothetical protein
MSRKLKAALPNTCLGNWHSNTCQHPLSTSQKGGLKFP